MANKNKIFFNLKQKDNEQTQLEECKTKRNKEKPTSTVTPTLKRCSVAELPVIYVETKCQG